MWCWHHIRENLNGLCPACRTPYSADPHAFSAVDRQEVVKKNREKKQKERQEKKVTEKPVQGAKAAVVVDRKHLHNYRVVQRNLVYVIGLPNAWSSEDLLRKAEYFGQYGRINKVVVHRNGNVGHATVSAYITFAHKGRQRNRERSSRVATHMRASLFPFVVCIPSPVADSTLLISLLFLSLVWTEDAKAAIAALDGFWVEGHPLRASFGTTKYCNNFIRSMPCNNPECVYLHDLGDEDDRFTKEEIQAGHTKLAPAPGKDQTVVTGNGGPSGTGKRPSGDPVLPPPIFLQDIARPVLSRASSAAPPPVTHSPAATSIPATASTAASSTATTTASTAGNNAAPVGPSAPTGASAIAATSAATAAAASLSPSSTSASESKSSHDAVGGAQTMPAEESRSAHNPEVSDGGRKPATGRIQQSEIYFNGLSKNAVFPVPISSLAISVWSTVLKTSSTDLHMNPFSKLLLPFSDLLDLTLPPVDASQGQWIGSVSTPEARFRSAGQPAMDSPLLGARPAVNPGPASNPASLSQLRQIFPGVNLSYGVAPGLNGSVSSGEAFTQNVASRG